MCFTVIIIHGRQQINNKNPRNQDMSTYQEERQAGVWTMAGRREAGSEPVVAMGVRFLRVGGGRGSIEPNVGREPFFPSLFFLEKELMKTF